MRKHTIKLIIYFAIILFFINDIVVDLLESQSSLGWHFYTEVIFIILTVYLLTIQFSDVRQTKSNLDRAKVKISNLQGEMINYINANFSKWSLTKAENEIAWLIIKGFSFKEIAKIRSVSEKTIQQQTSSIYKKSKTNNRHELMSLFLEEFIA